MTLKEVMMASSFSKRLMATQQTFFAKLSATACNINLMGISNEKLLQ